MTPVESASRVFVADRIRSVANFLRRVGWFGWAGWLAAAASLGYHFWPRTYYDCHLHHLKPGISNMAASIIDEACREKYPGLSK